MSERPEKPISKTRQETVTRATTIFEPFGCSSQSSVQRGATHVQEGIVAVLAANRKIASNSIYLEL